MIFLNKQVFHKLFDKLSRNFLYNKDIYIFNIEYLYNLQYFVQQLIMSPLANIISKSLGIAILFGSFALKFPQIYNILSTKSVAGISSISLYSEVPLFITSIAYNYLQGNPITTYGEAIAICIQTIIIILLFWRYSHPKIKLSEITLVLLSYILIAVISINLPPVLQSILVLANLPLLISSRVPQILKNMKQKSTGNISMVTTFLSFAGSCVRVLTTIIEVGLDFSLISTYLISALLSGLLVLQVSFYFIY